MSWEVRKLLVRLRWSKDSLMLGVRERGMREQLLVDHVWSWNRSEAALRRAPSTTHLRKLGSVISFRSKASIKLLYRTQALMNSKIWLIFWRLARLKWDREAFNSNHLVSVKVAVTALTLPLAQSSQPVLECWAWMEIKLNFTPTTTSKCHQK